MKKKEKNGVCYSIFFDKIELNHDMINLYNTLNHVLYRND